MPEIEITDKAYEVKKVTRKDLQLRESSSSDEDAEEEEDNEEGEVEISEEMVDKSVESE